MPPYRDPHWNAFSAIPFQAQGPVGMSPVAWVQRHHIVPLAEWAPLENRKLDRQAVRGICMDPAVPVLFAYIHAMAWGGQGSGPGGRGHVANAWTARTKIKALLTELRGGALTRSAAYELFVNTPVPGLGPSFFTKLLYFFSPLPNCYIMDQWTAKSVNLLTGIQVVRLAGHAPSNQNRGLNYQAFCEHVDSMAQLLGCSGEVAEERLFSLGGRSPWPWRVHVRNHWQAKPVPAH